MLRLFAAVLLSAYSLTAMAAESSMRGDPEAGKQKSQSCAACHAADGNSSNPMWPKLAGQHPDYLVSQLQAFKSGARENQVMQGQVQNLSEQDMRDLAAYFASQNMSAGAASASEEQINQAETLYRAGKRDAGMPACIACHGPKGNGVPGMGYPKISGQHAQYTAAQLKAYRSGERQGAQAAVMQTIAEKLTDAEIQALAQYVSGLH